MNLSSGFHQPAGFVIMAFGRELKRRARTAVAPIVFLSVFGYFGWNATQGDRGLVAYAQRQDLLKQAQDDLGRAEGERAAWERRVAGLRNNHLDRDTLDERARAMLNLAEPSDIVVNYAPKDRLF
jgi:cell division protein FtsB